jgi:uncharacterized membrane protein
VDRARLEAFSDGVFAVAITLLALNLAVAGPGHGSLAHQLVHQWPAYVAYAISFFTIGIIWVNHHALFRTVPVVDRTVVFLNLLLLFFVVAIPFATATMATYLRQGGADARLATSIFEGVFELMSLAFGAVFLYVVGHRLVAVPLTPTTARAAMVRFTVGTAAYLVAIGIAFVSPAAALAIAGAVAVYYMFERTPSAAEPDGP